MLENRSWIAIKGGAIQRYLLWYGYLPHRSDIFISEFPKSGGTWFSQLLSSISGIPFPRNQYVKAPNSILHSHLLAGTSHNSPICVIRDGRDVIVSAYFHFLIKNEHCPEFERKKWQKLMPFDNYKNCKKNIKDFIQIFFSNYTVGRRKINWSTHVSESLMHHNLLFVRYEDLLEDPFSQLVKSCEHLNISYKEADIYSAIESYSFDKQKQHGTNFLRKGSAGDWKNYFGYDACIKFDALAGDLLIQLGYETDRSWIIEKTFD